MPTTTRPAAQHPLFTTAMDADAAYQDALVRTYGRQAIEARYDYKRNGATAELATLADAKHHADAAWMDHLQEARMQRATRYPLTTAHPIN